MSDRTVHARAFGNDVVRYNRAGKWYVESADLRRAQVTLAAAVDFALQPGGEVYLGLPGGQAFDAKVRAAQMRTTQREDADNA